MYSKRGIMDTTTNYATVDIAKCKIGTILYSPELFIFLDE